MAAQHLLVNSHGPQPWAASSIVTISLAEMSISGSVTLMSHLE